MDIKEALSQLDTLDDNLWTQDGSPKIEAVSDLVGNKVTRAEILEAAPKFSRENPDTSASDDETKPNDETKQDEAEVASDEDFSLLDDLEASKPMSPADLAEKVLKKLPPKQLPMAEEVLKKQLAMLEAHEKEVAEAKRNLKLGLATTRTWIKSLIHDMSNQEAIQDYIKKSHEARARKANAIQTALGGLRPSDIAKLDPRAPIDKAFARKDSRGTARPTGR
jgi:hypothetical protein